VTEEHGRTFAAMWKLLSARFSRYLDEKTNEIDHHDVISDLVGRTELSPNYLSSITLSNLIALFGLLTNSVAVVIGAMLISPLMGPIFSLGLAFTMGDLVLTRRAIRNITYSILLAVFVAAVFTLISPLKGATHEILSRTRPNIYDLLIAVFAGTAGALALCTRKNYLFTTTGVAVATAVIPPLSVVGYGIGTWQFGIAAGGFLLFFTNLVAIVISSNAVFYACRFRGSMVAESRYPARRRFQILGTLLVIISIPLLYTLVTDIRKMKLTGQVENILRENFNHQLKSRLTAVSINKVDGKYIVDATINTVKYVEIDEQNKIEKELTSQIGSSKLELEQVIVRSGAVEPPAPLRTITPAAPPKPETLATLQDKTMTRLREGCREVESFIAPYKVSVCSVTFSDQKKPMRVTITLARDYPANLQELYWLATALEKKLNEKIELKVETTPFLPPIGFTEKDELDQGSIKAMEPLRQVITQWPATRFSIETPLTNRRTSRQDKKRAATLKEYLTKELAIPADHISLASGNEKLINLKVTN